MRLHAQWLQQIGHRLYFSRIRLCYFLCSLSNLTWEVLYSGTHINSKTEHIYEIEQLTCLLLNFVSSHNEALRQAEVSLVPRLISSTRKSLGTRLSRGDLKQNLK